MTNNNLDDDLVTVGIWDGVGLVQPDEIEEPKVFKIDFSKMLAAEELAKKGT